MNKEENKKINISGTNFYLCYHKKTQMNSMAMSNTLQATSVSSWL